jgi:hypothetical protein
VRADERGRGRGRNPDRGQLSLPVVEAAIGVVLVLGVTVAFTVGVPGPDRERAQLERYAGDVARTFPDGGTPGDRPLVERAFVDREAFEDEREALRDRAVALRPGGVRVRLVTPYGAVGPPRPPGVAVGRAALPTRAGAVRVEVWYG